VTQVEWRQSAIDDLTRIWTQADPATRTTVTAATTRIDHRLARDPIGESESRVDPWRVIIELPLTAYFRYEPAMNTVIILTVRRVLRRPSSS
jgi:plasmid stabilization system protein ParE